MSRTLLLILFITGITMSSQHGFSQTGKLDSLFAKGDTTAIMDSLMKGFDAFLDSLSQPKSFVSISVGVGNRTFSIKNNSLNTQESTTDKLSFTPSIGYYHKSGWGLGITGFLAALNNKLSVFQYALTPSYDYIGEKISAGISYTRYFGKDTATLNASPYENDWYGYVNIHHHSWRYGLAIGYATGSFSDKLSYRDSVLRYNVVLQKLEWFRYMVTVNSANKIKDLSVAASVRKDFNRETVFSKKDNLTLSFTAYIVGGASRINTSTNSNISTIKRKITLARFRRSYESADGNNFQIQSLALSASLYYSIGNFNLQPIWFMDYYFPDSDKKFSQVFSLAFGFNF